MSGWIAGAVVGTGLIGAGASIYGANKTSKAIDKQTAANSAAQAEANKVGWTNYLLTRGIQPVGDVTTGEMPNSYKAVNTRLPVWANVTRARPVLRRKNMPSTGATIDAGLQYTPPSVSAPHVTPGRTL